MTQRIAGPGNDSVMIHGNDRSTHTRLGLRAAVSWTALFAVLGLSAWALAGPSTPTVRSATAVTGPVAANASAGPEVRIKEYAFVPRTLTVPVGTTVTWTNRDEEPHTVTSSNGAFSSSGLDTDAVFSTKFSAPGTYTYFCALHPHMTATIIVK